MKSFDKPKTDENPAADSTLVTCSSGTTTPVFDRIVKAIECACVVATTVMTCYFLWSILPCFAITAD